MFPSEAYLGTHVEHPYSSLECIKALYKGRQTGTVEKSKLHK